jgi:WD40 repeat protein
MFALFKIKIKLIFFMLCFIAPALSFAVSSHSIFVTPNLCWKINMMGYSSNTIIFTRDHHFMAICETVKQGPDFGRVYIWDLKTGKLIWTIKQKTTTRTAIFSTNSKFLITGQDNGTASVFKLKNRKKILQKQLCNNWITSLAISPINNQIIAIGSQNGSLILWNYMTGEIIKKFKGHYYGIRSISFNPEGTQLLSAADDQHVKLWDVNSGKLIREFQRNKNTLKAHRGMVKSIIYLNKNQVLSGAYWEGGTYKDYKSVWPPDEPLRVWDSRTGSPIKSYKLTWGVSCCIQKLDKSNIIIFKKLTGPCSGIQIINVFNLNTGKIIRKFNDPDPLSSLYPHGVQSFAVLPKTSIVFIELGSGRFILWNAYNDKIIGSFTFTDNKWAVVDSHFNYDCSKNFQENHDQPFKTFVKNSPCVLGNYPVQGLLAKIIGLS